MSNGKIGNSYIDDRRGTRIINGMVPSVYDRVKITYPTSTTEHYAFYLTEDGADGKLQGTIKLTYTDSTKTELSIVERI